ncbi:MAG: SgcJ/EcaC family oxidoreductase [Acidobacteriaceae bacterium]|nr:SgcJ/EcaC family oxidoreductase [Acidobacteriaceae bacterium]
MKHITVFCTLVAICALTATYSVRVQAYADDKSEITAVEQRAMDGFKAKDVNKIMSCYSPDESLFVFDVVPPREYVGAKAYRKDWEDLFARYPGPAEADISDLNVTANGTFGYAHLIVHSSLTDKEGKKTEINVRTTDVFRKAGGQWLIVHEHNSVPVDFATGKADLMAKP